MTDLINPANWGGAQWVLVALWVVGIIYQENESVISYIIGCIMMFTNLAWGGFWS